MGKAICLGGLRGDPLFGLFAAHPAVVHQPRDLLFWGGGDNPDRITAGFPPRLKQLDGVNHGNWTRLVAGDIVKPIE
jgi:hypothetical protein